MTRVKTYATALGLVAAAGFAGAAAQDAEAHWSPAYLSCTAGVIDARQFAPGDNTVHYRITANGATLAEGSRTFPGRLSTRFQVDYPRPLYGPQRLEAVVWWAPSDTSDGHSGRTYTGPVNVDCGAEPQPEPEPEPTPSPTPTPAPGPPAVVPPSVTVPGAPTSSPRQVTTSRPRLVIRKARVLGRCQRVKWGRRTRVVVRYWTRGGTKGRVTVRLRIPRGMALTSPAKRQGWRQAGAEVVKRMVVPRGKRARTVRVDLFGFRPGRKAVRVEVIGPRNTRTVRGCRRIGKSPRADRPFLPPVTG